MLTNADDSPAGRRRSVTVHGRRRWTLALLAATGCVIAGLVATTASAAPRNLIRDGGFEQPVVPAGSYQLFSPGQSFASWRVVGVAGNVAPISGAYTSGGVLFPSLIGKQWLDMTGLSNTATGVAQTVTTKRGARYQLSFAVGNVNSPGSIWGVASRIEVVVNGRHQRTVTNTGGAGAGKQVWQRFAVNFKARSRHTTIKFLNRDPHSDNTNGLDDVKLVRRHA